MAVREEADSMQELYGQLRSILSRIEIPSEQSGDYKANDSSEDEIENHSHRKSA